MRRFSLVVLVGLLLYGGTMSISTGIVWAEQEEQTAQAFAFLHRFAVTLAQKNRQIAASRHDLESARHARQKVQSRFAPTVTISEASAKSANRNYNSLTGIDEDYTTRRRGMVVSVAQKTPLGTGRLDAERSKTEYTNAQTTYFDALYLVMQTGLVRRDYRINRLERRSGAVQYRLDEARVDSVLLDVLLDGLQVLFDRQVAAQNLQFKERNRSFYQTMVEEAQVKLDNGLGSELDLKQAKMRLALAESGVDESRLTLADADRRLGILLGEEAWDRQLASFSPGLVAPLIPEEFAEEELLQKAERHRPDVRLMRHQYDLQMTSWRLARERSKPEVNATVRWGKQGRSTDEALAREKRDRSWEVNVSWETTLGHRPERLDFHMESERLKGLRERRSLTEEQARKAILQTIERLGVLRRNLKAYQASADLSAQVLEGQRLNFQLGKISLLDLSRYQEEYEMACLNVIRAEAALSKSWVQLLYEQGTLAEDLQIPLSSTRTRPQFVVEPLPAASTTVDPLDGDE